MSRWVAALLLVVAVPARARAAEYELTAGTSAGATDNALGVPEDTAGSNADVLLTARAGAGLAFKGRYSEQNLNYEFGYTTYARNSRGPVISNALSAATMFDPTPTVRIGFNAGMSHSRTSLDDTFMAPPGAPVQPVGLRLAEDTQYFSADAAQNFSWNVTPDWRLFQSFTFNYFRPLGEGPTPANYGEDLAAGVGRTWINQELTLKGRVGQTVNSEVRDTPGPGLPEMVVRPEMRSTMYETSVALSSNWTPSWHTTVDFGVFGMKLEGGKTHFDFSTGGVLTYADDGTEYSLTVARAAEPNVLVGGTILSERAQLSVSHPFGRDKEMAVHANGGYNRSRQLAGDGQLFGAAHIWEGAAGFSYKPELFLLSLDYTFSSQVADDAATPVPVMGMPPPAGLGGGAFRTYQRHMLMLTVEVRYSSAEAHQ